LTREEFKSLFNEHFDPLRNYVYYRCGDAELATDIAQEVFLKVWEKKPMQETKKLIGLLYKMARDIFISKYRHSKTEMEFIARSTNHMVSQSPEEQMSFNELKCIYEKALKQMPVKQREVFLMSRMEELKYHEIAQRLELSIKAVEKRMKHALHFLREALAVQ